jgi:hypothetical protein
VVFACGCFASAPRLMDGSCTEYLDDQLHLMQRSSGEAFEPRRRGGRCADDGDTEVAPMEGTTTTLRRSPGSFASRRPAA